GFFYTNTDSVSIGVVLRLDDLVKKGKSSSEIHDHFLTHPAVSQYLEGGELIEYGCHLIAEGGQKMQHDLVRDGLVIVGDAAGFTLNTGFT
ncbi:FAD-dependent oxidoreductase, partial [Pauljensenia sp. UMB0018B]|nr:FAD-dependent oxidoreductase [Pauljensenia sp. UMB0018B]